jgi:hypothetical protein
VPNAKKTSVASTTPVMGTQAAPGVTVTAAAMSVGSTSAGSMSDAIPKVFVLGTIQIKTRMSPILKPAPVLLQN